MLNITEANTKNFKIALNSTLTKIDFPNNLIFFARKPKFIESDTYITYQILKEKREEFAGDKYQAITWEVQINIFTNENFEDLKENIIEVLEAEGLILYDLAELFLDDVEKFHIPLKFRYKILK